MSDKILVFGHQKPDTDAIGSSYGFSYLSNHRPNGALNTEVVALGTPNEETQFVLDYFGVKAPRKKMNLNNFKFIFIFYLIRSK